MTEIEDWLEQHVAELADIAREGHVGPGLVHLLAVLILGGLDDERILDQLRGHVYLEDEQERLREVPGVMRRIRDLTAA